MFPSHSDGSSSSSSRAEEGIKEARGGGADGGTEMSGLPASVNEALLNRRLKIHSMKARILYLLRKHTGKVRGSAITPK